MPFNMSRYIVLFFSFFILLSSSAYSQAEKKAISGKWMAVYEYNTDSTFFSNFNQDEQLIYHLKSDGSFIFYHNVKAGNTTRTYKTIGRWKLSANGTDLVLFNRSPSPPRNMIYGDMELKVTRLEKNALSLYGNFSIGGEGSLGTQEFKRIK
jgi:hypothetical protein